MKDFLYVVAFTIGLITGLVAGKCVIREIRNEAIEAGAGKWTCDEWGNVKWEWVTKGGK